MHEMYSPISAKIKKKKNQLLFVIYYHFHIKG